MPKRENSIFFCPESSRKFFVEGYNVGVEPAKQAPIIDIDRSFPEQERIPAFNKILLIRPDKEVVDMLSRDPDLELVSSGIDLFDVMCKGVTKGRALLDLAEYLGIPSTATFAIGDSDNDIPMIADASYGIAMGNATDEVKAAANYVTDTVDNDGVEKAFRYLGI